MKAGWIIFIVVVIVILGGIFYMYEGYYDISAVHPHWKFTLGILDEVRERSIAYHSRSVQIAPGTANPAQAQIGLKRFQESCRLCHGAPGALRDPFAGGLYPNPPYLGSKDVQAMNDQEIFWVVKNGIKFTGMPAFAMNYKDDELWGIVQVIRSLPSMKAESQQPLGKEAGPGIMVQMTNEFKYVPSRVKIQKGGTVEWKNVAQVVHTVTADPGRAVNPKDVALPAGVKPFDSGDIQPGQTFSYRFSIPGMYRYFCVPHEVFGMVGEVEVIP